MRFGIIVLMLLMLPFASANTVVGQVKLEIVNQEPRVESVNLADVYPQDFLGGITGAHVHQKKKGFLPLLPI